MGRFASCICLTNIILVCVFLAGCSSSKSTRVVSNQIPAVVTLLPGPDVSIEVGKTQVLTASARSATNTPLLESFTFESSNTAVVTIASNGTVCAGTWNSLIAPQVCTPGPTGSAQVTATAQGVTSAPVTIYVHQHITNIVIQKAPSQLPTLSSTCLSKGAPTGPESQIYEAFAFDGSTDVTASVGPFTWQAVNANIAKVTALPPGSPLNQQIVAANDPGSTPIFASVSGLNSQPIQFTTCPVQAISIDALGNPSKSFLVNTGTSTTLNATVTDTVGMTITAVPLTWTSTNPASVTVNGANTSTVFGSVGTVAASGIGGSTVIASCTPPTCNSGLRPSQPIYPQDAVSFTVRSNTAPPSPTVYASTTACATANPTNAACNTLVVPITRTSSTSAFAAGSPIALPFTPNSIVFDPRGNSAYLGVDSSVFGQKGIMVLNGSSATPQTVAAGRVLAVSPDSTMAVLSDTADSPNQVFVYNNSTHTASDFLINGATAAAFSPDGLKAYIVAGTNLYVFSKVDAFQTIPLSASANDVRFFPQGGFALIAGGAASALTVRHTCDNTLADSVTLAATPSLVRALPDAATVLALEPPFVQFINLSPPSGSPWVGCAPPVQDAITSTFNLGQDFIAKEFIISPDGAAGYILANSPQPNSAPLPFIIALDIANQASSLISLNGSATPLSASLSPTGNLLFVGADDGAVHVVDTSSGTDTEQVAFAFPTPLCFGPGNPATPVPLTQVAISAATQNGSNTAYTYSVTTGPALQTGQSIIISGMTDGANNGTFAITGFGVDQSGNPTLIVNNASGVSDGGQNGTGVIAITCNPDLVAVKP